MLGILSGLQKQRLHISSGNLFECNTRDYQLLLEKGKKINGLFSAGSNFNYLGYDYDHVRWPAPIIAPRFIYLILQ